MDVFIGRASNVGQQNVLEVMKMNSILCGVGSSMAGRLRITAMLLYLALMGLHLGYCAEFWAPQYKRHVGKVVSAAEGHQGDLSLENRCAGRWRETYLKDAQEQWL